MPGSNLCTSLAIVLGVAGSVSAWWNPLHGADQQAILSAARGTYAVPLVTRGDFHLLNVTIGTPPQPFNLSLYLHTDDFMVYSTASRSGTGKSFPQHHMYNATRSSTYKNRFRADFVVQWNHKELGGPVSHDTVRLGNLSLADRSFLELKRVAFGGPLSNLPGWPAAETLPTWPTDGALGLATPWSTWQDEGPNALLDMLDRSVLVSPVFGLKLPPAHAQRGELFFGGTNPELYTGAFRSVPVQAFDKKKDRPRRFLHGLWDLTLDAVTLHAADAPAVRFPTPKGAALLTTWRTIILPDAVADLLEPHYPNATRVNMRWKQIPCSLRSALPRLSFELAGHTFTLDGFDYTEEIGEEEAGELEYGREQVQGEAPWCVVTASGGYLDGRVMLGTPFLRKFYARFDMAERTVGFAELK